MYPFEASLLPHLPGVYEFFNAKNELIYVGKAKDLRKRISSYFRKQSQPSRKLKKLVAEIGDIKYTITDTEYNALLLENRLIKAHQPRYNILLKDDKTYPYICISKESFPKIFYTRQRNPNEGEYFGPYTSLASMHSILELLHQLHCFRTCTLPLSSQNIVQKKFKVCLEYHIGNCKGPCVSLQSESDYEADVASAREALRGNLAAVSQLIRDKMRKASDTMQYEQAAVCKNRLDLLKKFQEQSTVVDKRNTEIDVITIVADTDRAFVNYMQIKEGRIVFSENKEVVKKIDEPNGLLLSYVLQEARAAYNSKNKLILSNYPIEVTAGEIKNVVPQIGDKRKLVELSLKNALHQQKNREQSKQDRRSAQRNVLEQLQHDMFLKRLPHTIECFDISGFHGSFPVASMVSFVGGKSSKANYRRYNIKTVVGVDDFASMREVVFRRYSRLLAEGKDLPDLIVIDGGKGQLSHACDALVELNVYERVQIVSIAKKLEEIYRPGDPTPLHIDRRSPSLLLIQQIRNEAHRFAVSFHRAKRGKGAVKLKAEEIPGIGKKTLQKLLAQFKTWNGIKTAGLEELSKVVGKRKANLLLEEASRGGENRTAEKE